MRRLLQHRHFPWIPSQEAPSGGFPAVLRLHARLLGHILFWVAVLAFYTLYFGRHRDNYGQSLVFVGVLLPFTIVTTYFLLYWLIPRYLLTRKYGYFVLYFCYTLIFSVYLELMLVVVLFMTVAGYRGLVVEPVVDDLLDVVVGMYLVVFLGVALHLLGRWYRMQTLNARLERDRLETALKLKEAELKLLKSQIHPHFLFNTLNNLYGLTLERSDRAPDVVLHIAGMLDYMLYRADAARVPLADEVEQIRNYLALERLRYGDRLEVAFETQGDLEVRSIAPLLLIPFVENCFKHGVGRSHGAGWVRLSLAVQGRALTFTAENSAAPGAGGAPPGTAEGIGLQNVRRRLELLYPGRHRLAVAEHADRYHVALTLELDPGYEDQVPHR